MIKIFGLAVQSNFCRTDYGVKFVPSANVIRESQKDYDYFKKPTKLTAKYAYALHPNPNSIFYFSTHHTIEGLLHAQIHGTELALTTDDKTERWDEDFEWITKPLITIGNQKVRIPKELKIEVGEGTTHEDQ